MIGRSKITAKETIGIEMTTSVKIMIMMFTNLLQVIGRSKITAKETIGIEMTTRDNHYDYNVVYKTFYESGEEVR